MKKKILLILTITLISLSGCTANYTLKYENDTFTEIVNITGTEESTSHPTYEKIKENGLHADLDLKEKFTLSEDSNKNDVTLTHELKDIKLNRLYAVQECFSLNTYKETDNSYFLYLYGDFYCDYLENSTFTFETDDLVTVHNAHKVEGNKYIWNLDEEELDGKGIKFQVMQSEVDEVKINGDTMLPLWAKILITLIIIGVTIGLFFLAKRTNER